MLLAGTPLAKVPDDELGAGVWDMVADGAGHAWVKGPWELTRVDVATGAARTWDANDMAKLLSPDLRLAATTGEGVWLLVLDKALLFDGNRITRRLHVPAKLVTKIEGQESLHIHDLVEMDDQIWVSVHHPGAEYTTDNPSGMVLRWVDKHWTAMSKPADNVGGALDVAEGGSIWAGGWALPESNDENPAKARPGWDLSACKTTGRATGPGVRRWDGTAWALPGAGNGHLVPDGPGDVAAQGGSAWFLDDGSDYCSAAGVEGVDGPWFELLRYDGSRWRLLLEADESPLPSFEELISEGGGRTLRDGWLQTGTAGQAWVAGAQGLIRVNAEGTVTTFASDGEESTPTDTGLDLPLRHLAVTDSQVLVLDGTGLSRLVGDRFEPLWQEPLHSAWVSRHLLAVSSSELLADTLQAGVAAPTVWHRFVDDRWQTTDWPTQYECSALLAGDGAIWIGTPDGLTRIEDGQAAVVVAGADGCPVAAAPDGQVWYRGGADHEMDAGGPLELVGRGGERRPLELPKRYDAYCVLGGGLDGSLWIARPIQDDGPNCDTYGSGDLARWDGHQWSIMSKLDLPQGKSELFDPVVAADGSVWGRLGQPGSLVRHDGHGWVIIRERQQRSQRDSSRLIPASGDRVCIHPRSSGKLTCLRSDGSSIAIASPALATGSPAIAPDGAIWILGDQIARLPQTLPALTP